PVSPIPPLVCPHLVLFSAHLPLPSSTLFPTRRSSDLHHEPTDAPLAHELGGLEHGFPRLHRDDITALSGKNVLDGRHVTASWLGFPRYYRAVAGCATLSGPPEAGASMAQARINVGPLDAHAR